MANTTETYETGKSLKDIRIEEAGSGIFPISGNLGRRIFQNYKKKLENGYKDYSLLHPLFKDSIGRIKNANPFIKVLLNPILEQEGLALPRFRDFAMALKYFPIELGSFTIDLGFVLRSNEDVYEPNKIITENLADQVSALNSSLEFPLLISLRGTKLADFPGSRYNHLSFGLTKDTEIISAPILNQGGYFSPEDIDENTCLPKTTRLERKQRDLELIVGQSGLCRAYINVFGDIDTETNDLGISDYSPVLVVKK
jgi:hypothetical protein